MSNFFDDLIEDDQALRPKVSPFHMIQDDSQDEILDWLKQVSEFLLKSNTQRHTRLRGHLAAYRGIQFLTQKSRSDYRSSERVPIPKTQRLVVNHLFDLVETRVSQLTRLKPTIEVLPRNDEHEDKQTAKATKMLYDHLSELNNLDKIYQDLERQKLIFGETYLFITWDPSKGDRHPAAGQTVVSEDGKQLQVPDDLQTGDVCYEIELPWRVLLQNTEKWEDVEYIMRVKVKTADTLKKEYPGKAKDIKSDANIRLYDVKTMRNNKLEDEVVVYEFYHKKTKHTKEGRLIKFTATTILEDGPLPYTHGSFPCERYTDLDLPESLHAVSRLELIKPIQNMHNNLSTMLAKNIYMMGHAKWLMPRGAVNKLDLTNDHTIIQYQGPVPPQMVQGNPNPPEAFGFREKLKEEMEQIYGVHGVSRGQPPQGVTAAVALQFLNEEEFERSATDIAKRNQMIQSVARKSLSVAGDNYEPDDGRMLRILGKDNRYFIRSFDSANLHKPYDIKILNSSALAETKSAKIQRILETMERKPNLLSDERWVDLLDLGSDEKMNSLITEAIRSAESENEDLLSGREVADPEEWEDLILHWRTHTKEMQKRSFKEEVPPELREEFKKHVEITEFLMAEKALENPLFEAKLAQLELYPIFHKPGTIPRSREHQTVEAQGAFNRGEPTQAQIPAIEPDSIPGEQTGGSDGR